MEKLPVDDFLEEIKSSLNQNSRLILSAAPGAGKTTRVPPALSLNYPGKVLVLEPRRMAAVSACHRIAEEQKWSLGKEIGYQVRFENKTSSETKLIFMTEALLARQMLSDPELKGVDLVILDEFHERSASVDLTLSLLKELRSLGSEIKILIMSATLQSQEISNYLEAAPILEIPGKLFPLQISQQKNQQKLRIDKEFFESVKLKIKNCLSRTKNDILVFLPGVGEIRRLSNLLEEQSWMKDCLVSSLHGRLSLEEQGRVLQKGNQQRVILSTNIAESSVTVNGVDTVIDCGLEKVSTWDYRTGFSRLEVQRISLASSRQRAGRAARQKEGFCEQMWSSQDELSMSKDRPAEIQRIDLSEILLFLAHHGIRNFENFDWFQKPELNRLRMSLKKLFLIEALTPEGRLTPLGREIIRWPLSPELGVILSHFVSLKQIKLGAQIVSCLQEPDFLKIKPEEHPEGLILESDLSFRLDFLSGKIKLDRSEIQFSALERIKDSTNSLMAYFSKPSSGQINTIPSSNMSDTFIKKELLKCWPHRLCRRRENTNRGICFDGHGVQLATQSFVKESAFFLILNGLDGTLTSETLVSSAIGLNKEDVMEVLKSRIELNQELKFNEDKQEILLSVQRKIGAIPLEEAQYERPTPSQLQELLPKLALSRWDLWINENKALSQYLKRIVFLIQNFQFVPDKCQDAIQKFNVEDWKIQSLNEACYAENSYKNLISKDLYCYFENNLPEEIRRVLVQEVPEEIQVPSGKIHKINYDNPDSPTLEIRLQEIFGWSQSPSLLYENIKLTLSLLAPNYRSVQLTKDLSSFWKNAYTDVKKELRSRYPKHSWPDNPLEAQAIAGPRKRKL
ncbi:MAG: ATP-dependent helicase HrpB [Bdellovibrionota bacterium]